MAQYHDARACSATQIGAVLLTAQHAGTERGQTIFYIIAQFVFGRALYLTRVDVPAVSDVLPGFLRSYVMVIALHCHYNTKSFFVMCLLCCSAFLVAYV